MYYFSLARAYRSGDLSQVYPLSRGLAPVWVAIAAMLFADEYLSLAGTIGVCTISLGIVSLIFSGQQRVRASSTSLRWGLTTSVLIAMYTIVDGLGVRASGMAMSYIVWLFSLESIPVVAILLCTRRREWWAYMRDKPMQMISGGIASTVAYGLVIFAMSLGAMAIVSSLRETSVLLATLMGTLVLKEPFGRYRIRAALCVVVGVIVMQLG